ncbi:MAG: magnesium/cobalt transporter CorA [Prolixibacteraceae bacterium]|nr:magnesium/cobalt transporter CorA [Prolixibacteraceae bacterium]
MARFLKNRAKLIGQSPGSLTFIGSKKMEQPRLRLISYNKTNLEEHESTELQELLLKMKEDHVNWLNVDGLHDPGLIGQIGEHFKLSSLALEDIMNTDQRPKVMEENDTMVVFLKHVRFIEEKRNIAADQLSVILGPDFVVTFQEKVGDMFNPIREKLRQNFGKLRGSRPDYLFYRIIDTMADQYLLSIGQLGELVEGNELKVLSNVRKETINDIYRLKTELSFIRKAIRPALEVSGRIKISDSGLINKSTRPYFNDLDDLLTHALETVEMYHTMISDQLNICNTTLSNRANDVMKVLTIFAAIFIPLTFIVGVYGTNFDYLPELHYRYSYFIMWGVMITMVVIMLFYFKRKKWL